MSDFGRAYIGLYTIEVWAESYDQAYVAGLSKHRSTWPASFQLHLWGIAAV